MKISSDAVFYYGQQPFQDFLHKTEGQGPCWALLSEQGDFLTLESAPKLKDLQVSTDLEGLHLGLGKMFFKVMTGSASQKTLELKDLAMTVRLEPDLYSQAIAQFLGQPCRLVRF